MLATPALETVTPVPAATTAQALATTPLAALVVLPTAPAMPAEVMLKAPSVRLHCRLRCNHILTINTALDPKVLATGFENDGQDVPAAGQVASLTSSNNFINFCLTVPNLPITNGQQIKTGSCNPAPMGVIPASTNMPSSKFTNPQNFGTIKSNTAFTVTMAISHLETGFFVNANENYFSAPQQVNSAGDVQGHSHVVIEQISSLTQTTATDPTKFAFFKGLNDKAQNGVLSADVTSGLPAGVYRLSSINTAANHQPVLGPIAQHGSFDDQIYVSPDHTLGFRALADKSSF